MDVLSKQSYSLLVPYLWDWYGAYIYIYIVYKVSYLCSRQEELQAKNLLHTTLRQQCKPVSHQTSTSALKSKYALFPSTVIVDGVSSVGVRGIEIGGQVKCWFR
jgi:hypothetical protein